MEKKRRSKIMHKIYKYICFVFYVFSFFYIVNSKAYAAIETYKYTFDMGPGVMRYSYKNDNNAVRYDVEIEQMKMVVTVEENTKFPVNDFNRYNVVNRELVGFENYGTKVSDHMVINERVCEAIGIGDLKEDSNKNIYDFLCYASKSTESKSSRKLTKAVLMSVIEEGWKICIKENGDRVYLKNDPNASGDEVTKDKDFSGFAWLYDRKWLNLDCYSKFYDKDAKQTAYNPKFAKNNMWVQKDSLDDELDHYLRNDVHILMPISMAINSKSNVGKFFAPLKVKVGEESDDENSTYKYWVKEDTYNKNEKSILVAVGAKKGVEEFCFKYDITGKSLTTPPKQNLRRTEKNPSYTYEIVYNPATSASKLEMYKEYSGKKAVDFSTNITSSGPKKDFFVAINGVSYAQNGMGTIYVSKFNKSTAEKKYGERRVYGNSVCSISTKDLDKKIKEISGEKTLGKENTDTRENNGYVFTLDKKAKTITFTKKNDPSYVGLVMDFKDFYSLFIKEDNSETYGLALKADPEGKNVKNAVQVGVADKNGKVQMRLPAIMSNKKVVNDKGEVFEYSWSQAERKKNMFYCISKDSAYDAKLVIYDLSKISKMNRGVGKGEEIKIKQCKPISQISIREWLSIIHQVEYEDGQKKVIRERSGGTLVGSILDEGTMNARLTSFYNMLKKYAKPLIMFFIFIAIIVAGLTSIMNSGDADKRALVKLRIMHIVYGAIAFAAVFLIIGFVSSYLDRAAELLKSTTETVDYSIDGRFNQADNWLIKLIAKVLDAICKVIEWVINFLVSRILSLGDREIDLGSVIFGVEDAGGITLYPFTKEEWNVYMFGYTLLSSLFMGIVAIGLVKHVATLILNSGNANKVAEVKQDFIRTVIAIMCVVLVPYAFRIMLTFVNYLVRLVPLDDASLDANFSEYGVLGSVCNIMFLIEKLKIFLAFGVRKIMMSFLLIATPVVFGLWAASNKFRSFDLWVGELLTNAFMQFTYALAFFFLIVVAQSQKNPITILLLIGMIIKLSDFVRDSLQGLYSQWGGINETQTAQNVYKGVSNQAKNAKQKADKRRVQTGRDMIKLANFMDKDHFSRGGRVVNNIGAIISGSPEKIITEKQRLENVKKEFKSEGNKKRQGAISRQEQLYKKFQVIDDKEANDLFQRAINRQLTSEDRKALKEKDGIYSEIADYVRFDDEYRDYLRFTSEVNKSIDNVGGFVSSMQLNSENNAVNSILSVKDVGTRDSKKAYEDIMSEYNSLVSDMENTIQELSDSSLQDEDRIKKDKHLQDVLKNIVDKAVSASERAKTSTREEVGTTRAQILRGQSRAIQELASRYNNYDVMNIERRELAENNFDTAEELMRQQEAAGRNPDDTVDEEIQRATNNFGRQRNNGNRNNGN